MSMRNLCRAGAASLLLAGAALASFSFAAGAGESPNLGKPATPEEIAAYDIDVEPDGAGLPPGSGTAKQGEAVYAKECQACHGEKGEKGVTLALRGGEGTIGKQEVKPLRTIGSYWPYATSVFAYVRRSMPFYNSKSLSNDELYQVTAYLLYINKIIGEEEVMNRQSLAKVEMPNRAGFRPFQRGD
jgi:mono/diheme cytochrome c family protein